MTIDDWMTEIPDNLPVSLWQREKSKIWGLHTISFGGNWNRRIQFDLS
jgi:hypothetical protein